MPGLKRTAVYTIDEVFGAIRDGHTKFIFNGLHKPVNLNSVRIQTFYQHGISCVSCGIEGQFFASEVTTSEETYHHMVHHLNLYAVDEKGEDVLMTKDHIIARSTGGTDHLSNMQTMCCLCNSAKGTMPMEYLQLHGIVNANGNFIVNKNNGTKMRKLQERLNKG